VTGCATTSSGDFSAPQSSLVSLNTSVDNQSSDLSLTSTQTSSSIVTLNTKWSIAMGGNTVNLTQFYSLTETLTSNLTATKVIDVQKVFNLDGSFYGFLYEALVDGNGGRNSNRFRVGLANSTYIGFQSVEDREHGNFGDIIINALKNSLKGKAAVYSNAWEIMISANDTVTAGTASETINPIADALESITTHYLSQINVE
jgi:hypothetical protein